eukprot:jgi/Tetstr1/460113/TSEL_005429.t1
MHIDKRSKIVMKPPKFKCDVKIHPQIQSPLPDKSFFMTLIGSAGSGKTSLMVNMLRSPQMYFPAFKHVHLVMPPHSLASLDVKIFKKHDKTYPDLDWATLDKIHEKTREAADEEDFSLLVIDDMAVALKDSENQRLMKLLIYNRRHPRLSIIMLVQSFNTIPLPVQKTISHFAMLKFKNKREYEAIFKELIFLDPHTADSLMRFVFAKYSDENFSTRAGTFTLSSLDGPRLGISSRERLRDGTLGAPQRYGAARELRSVRSGRFGHQPAASEFCRKCGKSTTVDGLPVVREEALVSAVTEAMYDRMNGHGHHMELPTGYSVGPSDPKAWPFLTAFDDPKVYAMRELHALCEAQFMHPMDDSDALRDVMG